MSNRKKRKLLPFIIIVLGLIFVIIFCVSPVKNITKVNNFAKSNDSIIKLESLNEVEFNNENRSLQTSVSLTEDDINNLIYNAIKNKVSVSAIETDINDDIKIYVNSDLLNIIPTQYSVEIVPSLKNNSLGFSIKSVQIGRIPVPKKLILTMLEESNSTNFSVDAENNYVTISTKPIEPFKLVSFTMGDKKIGIKTSYSINSLDDIKRLLQSNVSESIKSLLKNMYR